MRRCALLGDDFSGMIERGADVAGEGQIEPDLE